MKEPTRPANVVIASIETAPPIEPFAPVEVRPMHVAEIKETPAAPPPKSYRVVGIPMEGKIYITASGRTARMVPNKVLDERYFDIDSIRQQGFNLTEVG